MALLSFFFKLINAFAYNMKGHSLSVICLDNKNPVPYQKNFCASC